MTFNNLKRLVSNIFQSISVTIFTSKFVKRKFK